MGLDDILNNRLRIDSGNDLLRNGQKGLSIITTFFPTAFFNIGIILASFQFLGTHSGF